MSCLKDLVACSGRARHHQSLLSLIDEELGLRKEGSEGLKRKVTGASRSKSLHDLLVDGPWRTLTDDVKGHANGRRRSKAGKIAHSPPNEIVDWQWVTACTRYHMEHSAASRCPNNRGVSQKTSTPYLSSNPQLHLTNNDHLETYVSGDQFVSPEVLRSQCSRYYKGLSERHEDEQSCLPLLSPPELQLSQHRLHTTMYSASATTPISSRRDEVARPGYHRKESAQHKSRKGHLVTANQFSTGQLHLSIYRNCSMLTVYVLAARDLCPVFSLTANCNSYVQLSIIYSTRIYTDEEVVGSTKVVFETNDPQYEEKFSIELNESHHEYEDEDEKEISLFLTVWHKNSNQRHNKIMLGYLMIPLANLVQRITRHRPINGWFNLVQDL